MVRLVASLRLFRRNAEGLPAGVVLCTRHSGEHGKGRCAQQLGLTHFVDNNVECLWSLCRDTWGNMGEGLQKEGGVLVWFDADAFNGEADDVVRRELDRQLGRYWGRDRDAMERWVRPAISWQRVADLLYTGEAGGARGMDF